MLAKVNGDGDGEVKWGLNGSDLAGDCGSIGAWGNGALPREG